MELDDPTTQSLGSQPSRSVEVRLEKNGRFRPRQRRITEHRRMQNRQAQKNYRQKQKRRLQELEEAVGVPVRKRQRTSENTFQSTSTTTTATASQAQNSQEDDIVYVLAQTTLGSSFLPWAEDMPLTEPSSVPISFQEAATTNPIATHSIAKDSSAQVESPPNSSTWSSVPSLTGSWTAPDGVYTFVGTTKPPNPAHSRSRRARDSKNTSVVRKTSPREEDMGLITLIQARFSKLGLSPKIPSSSSMLNHDGTHESPSTPSMAFNPYINNIPISSITTLQAFLSNARLLGICPGSYFAERDSPFSPHSPCRSSNDVKTLLSATKTDLAPSTTQLTRSHPSYLDAFVFPSFRDRAVLMVSMKNPMFDGDELARDVHVLEGLVCHVDGDGKPWDMNNWEAKEWFLKKWWFLVGGEEEDVWRVSKQWWEKKKRESGEGGVNES